MTKNFSKISFLFLIITVIVCATAELVLLEVKYSFFAGGFLQVYPLTSPSLKFGFGAIYYIFNFLFYALIYLFFKLIFGMFTPKNAIVGFNFFMLAGIVTAVALTLQLQLHRYFADAMNAALMKTIAGGDINTAIAYASNELILFGFGMLILAIIYFLLNKYMRSTLLKIDDQKPTNKLHLITLILVVISLLIPATYLVNQHDTIRNNIRYSNAYSIVSHTLDNLSDFDNDGFGSFRYPYDNETFNATIYPGALDVPNNGIDEDGLFGDFIYEQNVNSKPTVAENKIKSKKNVVIIIMESARGDLRTKVIDGKIVAPNLNVLASEGSFFDESYSHTGFTSSSLSILFSGQFGNFPAESSIFNQFKQSGYEINIFSGQDESWGGLDKKLETRETATNFYDAQTGIEKRVFSSTLPSSIKLSEETLWQEFNNRITTINWNIPQLVYFNFQAAHFPYFHEFMTTEFVDTGIPRSDINIKNKEWLENTYWNSLNYADIYIGKIIEDLKMIGVWDNTLLVVTGDHGEELFDQNHLGHGFMISEVQLKIPFVTNEPNFEMPQPAGLVDIKQAIIRSIEDRANAKSREKQFVFQYIGSISKPQKIALRFSGNELVELDMRSMQVNLQHKGLSLPLAKALEDDEIKASVEQLVNQWALIRWKEFLANE